MSAPRFSEQTVLAVANAIGDVETIKFSIGRLRVMAYAALNAAAEVGETSPAETRCEALLAALTEIVNLQPEPYTFPSDWHEQIAACAECKRWQGHPIQQGICDDHRRPLWAREDHDASERRAMGTRMRIIARNALWAFRDEVAEEDSA